MSQPTLDYPCVIKEMPIQNVLSLRLRAPVQELPQRIGEAYAAIGAYMHEAGIPMAGPPFVAYYNDDMDNLDIAAGAPVAEPAPGSGDILAGTLPAMRAATCVHVGPYPDLHVTYRALSDWMQAHGCRGTGVAYEFYLNKPDTVAPEALETEIVMPLMAE